MISVHEHGNILHIGNAAIESGGAPVRGGRKESAVFVRCFAQMRAFFENLSGSDRRDGNPVAIAEILQEKVGASGGLVGVYSVAETVLRRHAANADDQCRFAAGAILRIAVAAVEKDCVKAFDGVQIARMHAEEHARLDVYLKIDHVI